MENLINLDTQMKNKTENDEITQSNELCYENTDLKSIVDKKYKFLKYQNLLSDFEENQILDLNIVKSLKKNNEETYKLDSIVTSVINKFTERSKIGKDKYGTDLDRTDLNLQDWINHAQEEHMDAILYLEKIKKIIVQNNLSI